MCKTTTAQPNKCKNKIKKWFEKHRHRKETTKAVIKTTENEKKIPWALTEEKKFVLQLRNA
jgi:hypothetical protein